MFDEKDILMHKGLMKLLDDASFSLKAREVKAFLAVYEWTKQLPNKKQEVKKKVTKRGNK